MKISYTRESDNKEFLPYALSYRFDSMPKFCQLDDCVCNVAKEGEPMGYQWISVLSEEKYGRDAKLSATCSFEGRAAPLFILAKSFDKDEHGVRHYGDYFEIVIYKKGVNVWEMKRDPARTENGGVSWKLRMGVTHSFEEGVKHTLKLDMEGDRMNIYADDQHYRLYLPDLYPDYHVGFSLCEGKCYLYDLSIE